jgi:hypothetical protein
VEDKGKMKRKLKLEKGTVHIYKREEKKINCHFQCGKKQPYRGIGIGCIKKNRSINWKIHPLPDWGVGWGGVGG